MAFTQYYGPAFGPGGMKTTGPSFGNSGAMTGSAQLRQNTTANTPVNFTNYNPQVNRQFYANTSSFQANPSPTQSNPASFNVMPYAQPAGPAPAAPSPSNNNQSLVDQYRSRGWNDLAAINADIQAGGFNSWAPANYDPTAEINSVFDETSNLLSDIEGRTRAGEQDFYSQYAKPYDAQLPVLGQQRDAALTSNTQQVDLERRGEQNALAAAREQFGELSQGVRQRFGGVGSAAEFASSLLGRELMRNTGKIADTAGANVRKLMDQASTIKTQYDTQVNALNQQKEAALAQARDLFRQRLSEIDSSRVGLAQNKAAAKLDALRELRNQAQTINNAVIQQQMNLQQMVAQADLNLRNAISGYQAQIGQPVELANLPGAQYSQVGGGSSQAPSQQNQVFGQAGRRIVGYDQNGQPIYG